MHFRLASLSLNDFWLVSNIYIHCIINENYKIYIYVVTTDIIEKFNEMVQKQAWNL
jgi:hypothetical protein